MKRATPVIGQSITVTVDGSLRRLAGSARSCVAGVDRRHTECHATAYSARTCHCGSGDTAVSGHWPVFMATPSAMHPGVIEVIVEGGGEGDEAEYTIEVAENGG